MYATIFLIMSGGIDLKIIAFSDSHGNHFDMEKALRKHSDAKAVIFCGDGHNDITAIQKNHTDKTFYCVKGNCDWCCDFAALQTVTLGGKKFLITHGHIQRVKESLMQLTYLGQQENADIIVFGHTHQQLTVFEGNMILINPGSVGNAGQYTTIEINENTGETVVKEFPHSKFGIFTIK